MLVKLFTDDGIPVGSSSVTTISEEIESSRIFCSTPFFDIVLLAYLQESPGSVETQSMFNLLQVLGSDCLYP